MIRKVGSLWVKILSRKKPFSWSLLEIALNASRELIKLTCRIATNTGPPVVVQLIALIVGKSFEDTLEFLELRGDYVSRIKVYYVKQILKHFRVPRCRTVSVGIGQL